MDIQTRVHHTPHGDVTYIRLRNASGASVELSTLGAGIVSVEVPDRNGHLDNVALAYASAADYMADGPCLGKIPGRYANRIAGGHLDIDGQTYQLAVNNGPNHLHGGPGGFQNRIWDYELLPDGVRFTRVSPDGEENYPATLRAEAEYRWSDDNRLTLTLSAEADAPTVVNLTSHAYWNLDGADSGSILDHLLTIAATRYIPTDETLIPVGTAAVADTPMDFRTPHAIGRDIRSDFPALRYGKGYDAGWLIDDATPGKIVAAAVRLESPASGRILTIDTDQPAAHVYSGNWLAGSPLNRSGRPYADYEGVAIEMQGVPDAPNQPGFPSQRVDPAHPYRRTIRFNFATVD